MKEKIFPIIFTTFIASILFFAIMCQTNYANTDFAIQKLEECDKTYDFTYKKGREEITSTYNYKIQDEKAIIVILEPSIIKINLKRDDLYPSFIDDYPVSIEKYKTFSIKQIAFESILFAAIILFISISYFKISLKRKERRQEKREQRRQEREAKKQENQNRL